MTLDSKTIWPFPGTGVECWSVQQTQHRHVCQYCIHTQRCSGTPRPKCFPLPSLIICGSNVSLSLSVKAVMWSTSSIMGATWGRLEELVCDPASAWKDTDTRVPSQFCTLVVTLMVWLYGWQFILVVHSVHHLGPNTSTIWNRKQIHGPQMINPCDPLTFPLVLPWAWWFRYL